MKAPRVNKFHKKPKQNETKNTENISANDNSELNNIQPIENIADTKVHLLAQELKFAQSLAGNDPKTRRKVLKNLKKWLHLRSTSSYPFSYEDFLRLWKGLFYCMWMSDKPLIQEALAEDISKLIHCFDGVKFGIKFYGAFLKVMCNEWFGLDQWRMDKFMMLVRRCTRQLFIFLQNNDWDTELVAELQEHLFNSVLNKSCSCGLTMHFIDIYPEEFAKILEDDIDNNKLVMILKPFVENMAKQKDKRLINHIRDNIFHHLIHQSDLGRIYREKYNVWASMGFLGTIDDIEEVNPDELNEEEKKLIQNECGDDEEKIDDDDEMVADNNTNRKKTKKELDLRAGRVDVIIPEIKFDPMELNKLFEEYLYKPFTNKNSRTAMRGIMIKLNKFANGVFPLGLHKMPRLDDEEIDIEEKAKDLLKYSKAFVKDTKVLKKVNKKKRKKIIYGDMKMPSLSENKQNSQNEWEEEEINEDFKPNGFTYSATVPTSDSDDDLGAPSKKRKTITYENGKVKRLKTNDKKKLAKKNNNLPENINNHAENGLMESEEHEKLKVGKKESKIIESGVDEWAKPLQDGEVEIFMSSRKKKLEEINKSISEEADAEKSVSKKTKKDSTLVINPFARRLSTDNVKTPKNALRGKNTKLDDLKTALSSNTSAEKRVKIVLTKNQSQDTSEYIKQVRNSPQTPYDADKKPVKGLLKPNLMPSPIHPFYKKKFGLNFNDMV